jgi:hypothetical protein
MRTGYTMGKQSEEEEELDLERVTLCVPGTLWANSQRNTPHHVVRLHDIKTQLHHVQGLERPHGVAAPVEPFKKQILKPGNHF